MSVHNTKYNSSGQIISGIRKLSNTAYGTGAIDEYGDPVIDWNTWSALSRFSDENGFDIRNVEANGKYIIEIQLPKSTLLIRYGPESGSFTAPKGTLYEELSLPYIEETVEYNEYRVIAESISVLCVVDKGKVAPMFNSIGGGVQYYHKNGSIKKMIKSKILERVPNNEH